MKFKFLGSLLMAALTGVTLTSCLGEPESETSFSIKVSNMIIPDDLGEEVKVTHNCIYNLRIDGVKNKIIVSTSSLSLNGNSNLSFTSNAMDGLVIAGFGSESGSFARGTAKLSNGQEVSSINGYYTSIVNYYEVTGDPFPVTSVRPMLVMNYRVGNSTVRTFCADSFFRGETTTSYSLGPNAPEKNFTTSDAVYRVKFAEDMKTASVVIYNVQFAEEMQKKLTAVVLKDLPVTLGHRGYIISGTDLVPEMLDDSGLTPMPRYTFDRISIESTDAQLTSIRCDYTVAGSFKGVFEGITVSKFEAGTGSPQ